MRIACLTPLPPVKSGIANYAAMLLPALAQRADLTVVTDTRGERVFNPLGPDGTARAPLEIIGLDAYQRRSAEFDAALYQLGNNPYHEHAYREAMRRPGVVVLHEIVLHHLIVEMTLARGDVEGYVEILRRNHGEAGAAWGRARSAGQHTELANFLFPASIEVASRSRAVIVHNRYAGDRLRDLGVDRPIHVVEHPYVPLSPTDQPDRESIRRRFGFSEEHMVIGMFGFVTEAKRPGVVMEAFGRAAALQDRLRLFIVGETAPNIDLESIAADLGVPRDRWVHTGYVSDEEFEQYVTAVDRVVSLRHPTAGETSGALFRVFHAGRPVAVSDYAQFAELPDTIVTKVPLGGGEIDRLQAFMLAGEGDPGLAERQREWLRVHADADQAAEGTMRALRGEDVGETPRGRTGRGIPLPLFPALSADVRRLDEEGSIALEVRLRNAGSEVLRAAVYGAPSYRLLLKLYAGGEETYDRWFALPSDLHPGGEAILRIAIPVGLEEAASSIALFHAMEGAPHFDGAPFAVMDFPR